MASLNDPPPTGSWIASTFLIWNAAVRYIGLKAAGTFAAGDNEVKSGLWTKKKLAFIAAILFCTASNAYAKTAFGNFGMSKVDDLDTDYVDTWNNNFQLIDDELVLQTTTGFQLQISSLSLSTASLQSEVDALNLTTAAMQIEIDNLNLSTTALDAAKLSTDTATMSGSLTVPQVIFDSATINGQNYTFAPAQNPGDVLQTDGAGNTSWAAPAGVAITSSTDFTTGIDWETFGLVCQGTVTVSGSTFTAHAALMIDPGAPTNARAGFLIDGECPAGWTCARTCLSNVTPYTQNDMTDLHSFTMYISTTLASGSHSVCAWACNDAGTDANGNLQLLLQAN